MNSRITRSTACYSGKPWSPLDRPEMFRPGALNILAVCGPTAVGKTKFAIECARALLPGMIRRQAGWSTRSRSGTD